MELKRLSPHTPCYKLRDADAVFDFHAREFEEKVLTVEEALLAVKNSDSPITFQGVLTEKDFIKALSSRTKREVTVLAYGTPGRISVSVCARGINDNNFRHKNASVKIQK